MGLIEKQSIISKISPPVDRFLTTQLVDEFVSMERRYIQRDWEPTELDGGQFCEILARILYHHDSKNLNYAKEFADCLKYLRNDNVPHTIQPRHDALHIAKVIETAYKFRSQRGAVHISPNYTPNQMDSKFVIEAVRWAMNDTLRLFWGGDREEVARTIRELLQFDVPCIGKFEEVVLVQRTDLNDEEEILLLLHYAGDLGMARRQLGVYCLFSPTRVTRAIDKLIAPNCRQIVQLMGGNYRLTDLGSRRLREQLADKLLLQ